MTEFISPTDSCRLFNWALSICHFVCECIHCPYLESVVVSSEPAAENIFANLGANVVYPFDQKMFLAFEQLLLKIKSESDKLCRVHGSSILTGSQTIEERMLLGSLFVFTSCQSTRGYTYFLYEHSMLSAFKQMLFKIILVSDKFCRVDGSTVNRRKDGTCQFTVCPLPTGMTDQRTTYTIEETLRCMAIEWTINDMIT